MQSSILNNKRLLWWLTAGIVIMLVTYAISPDNPWALLSSLFGVCSVVLCAQGKLITFFFGFGQILTYSYVCWQEKFYAALAINAFYFLSQIYGIYEWRKRQQTATPFRRLNKTFFLVLCVVLIVLSLLVGYWLSLYTDDTQPYLDAFTTVPAFAAQILLVLAYREQWFIWLAIDILYMIMWLKAESYCMSAQYLFWCANAIYGSYLWTITTKQSSLREH